MKIKHLVYVAFSIMTCNCYSQSLTNKMLIPLGGNSWVTVKAKNGKEEVTNKGWKNWEHSDVVWSTYIKINTPGVLKVSVALAVPEGKSKIACSIERESKIITVAGKGKKEYAVGEWKIAKAGYVKIDMKGIAKTGKVFADVSELPVEGTAVNEQTAFVKNNDDNYFYWGRRGPSVHLNYDISEAGDDIEWFYNEITVPVGSDPIGSYFMTNGFGEGYFGIQVNSPTERRILFSVWSPFNTDDPKEIPADKKILMLKKGKGVHTGEFGNEGSGGQSYLKYNWKAGETYKFLLRAEPVGNNYTNYTAYFYAVEEKQWLLIACFSRPATHTYLTHLHSFLENFDPLTGYISRKAWYHNQWVKTKAGEWKAITKMLFTGDATAGKGYRLDYAGGAEGDKFYLRNCGFFNDNTVLKTKFSHTTPAKMPEINFSDLQ
ncbi:MAG: DUF3472 domain-containing protein [Chitinophagaceae bacterium]|nr:DUF3472 domain-containing protein [Chitinophagaceae bacterium]